MWGEKKAASLAREIGSYNRFRTTQTVGIITRTTALKFHAGVMADQGFRRFPPANRHEWLWLFNLRVTFRKSSYPITCWYGPDRFERETEINKHWTISYVTLSDRISSSFSAVSNTKALNSFEISNMMQQRNKKLRGVSYSNSQQVVVLRVPSRFFIFRPGFLRFVFFRQKERNHFERMRQLITPPGE